MILPIVGTVQREAYAPTTNGIGEQVRAWAAPAAVSANGWWTPTPDQVNTLQVGRREVVVKLELIVPQGTVCGDYDRWTVDGTTYEQAGGPADYSHGPWGMSTPLVVHLTDVEG